MKSNNGVIY